MNTHPSETQAIMYFDKAYKLSRTVKNPTHDRRYNYGSAAIKELPAGTIIFAFTPPKGREPYTWTAYYDAKGNQLAAAHEGFGKAIAAALEPYEPSTWEEVWVFNFGHIYEGQLREAITDLINLGAIDIAQLIRSGRYADEKERAEDEARFKAASQ